MSVPVEETIAGTRRLLRPIRGKQSIGFVPTMGALHAGHARLIELARQQTDFVVVSIFVNPLQFDVQQDYDRYQRTLHADVAICAEAGADLVFAPSPNEMYRAGSATFVDVAGLTDHFCGASRPGHFRGVCTVVSKLFHVVAPDQAFFGEKDAQQLAVIQRMVRDLDFAIEIVGVPTVREPDGLALSSRNARLTTSERALAPCLYQALLAASELIATGETDVSKILRTANAELNLPNVRVDYFDLADPETMTPVTSIAGPVRAMGAIWIGTTRLIDNHLCTP